MHFRTWSAIATTLTTVDTSSSVLTVVTYKMYSTKLLVEFLSITRGDYGVRLTLDYLLLQSHSKSKIYTCLTIHRYMQPVVDVTVFYYFKDLRLLYTSYNKEISYHCNKCEVSWTLRTNMCVIPKQRYYTYLRYNMYFGICSSVLI